MMITIRDRRPVPELDDRIERLRNLAQDLERIRRGEHPGRRTLAGAPLLEDWSLTTCLEHCLTGTMHGHPTVGDGRKGVTSGLWVFAPALGYARTLSRLYALGRRHDSASSAPR
ncbi:DUF6634 family protein [Microvirga massiliensis]|uniref:DUF6634 family protein n=1 Tax=Microvirga massiliensis TaxID=1033741 RepID=UPI00062B3438|nr:DUF6634 family protein [Microvirga massiliensis]